MANQIAPPATLHLAFDIGHASIGWAVLQEHSAALPEVLGCGAVIFPGDDCLASKRRTYRRQRRHVRATRQRIERIAILLHHLLKDAPSADDRAFAAHLKSVYLDTPPAKRTAALLTGENVPENCKPHPSPWLLAARVLAAQTDKEKTAARLTWPRLWDVLRWYAHNRGYDGNRLWSKVAADDLDQEEMDAADEERNEEDAKKVKNARKLLDKFRKQSMAETIAARLRIGEKDREASSEYAYKTCDAAFPRRMVREEVRKLLATHTGHLHAADDKFTAFLCADRNPASGPPAWTLIEVPGLKFPLRYQGGLLFGQIVPRFDNRIIGKCPVTGAKKPLKWCREYLAFRWAQQLANVTVHSPRHPQSKLTAAEKQTLTGEALAHGGFTAGDFKKRVRELTGTDNDNLAQLLMHPDADKALVLDPARRFTISNEKTAAIWPLLPPHIRSVTLQRWRRGRDVSLASLLKALPEKEEAFRKAYAVAVKKQKKSPPTWEAWLKAPLAPDYPSGRAPYARHIMQQAVDAYLDEPGKDPRLTGHILDPIKLREKDEARPLDDLTNNHLVRQRLRILEGDPQPANKDPRHRPFHGLLHDIVAEYAGGDRTRIATCTVEVASDLQEFSGKTTKEVAQDLGIRLKNFSEIVKKLHEAGIDRPSAGLIRKARIADDLKWRCPYTDPKGLRPFDVHQLQSKALDKDHIIPRSLRASDSLDSLVITYPEINRLKGNLTSLQFMRANEGKTVRLDNGQEVTLASVKDYLAFVAELAPEKKPTKFSKGSGHLDDKLRRWRRAQRMLLEKWDREDKEFTPGDLTRTSHLMRLGAQRISRWFGWHLGDAAQQQIRSDHRIISLPGQVTAEVRKAWQVTGCLIPACPEVADPASREGKTKTKKEIREITHLHHALDACVMGLTAALMPNHGKLWEQIANRKVRDADQADFHAQRRDARLFKLSAKDGRTQQLELADLPTELKNQITARLLERRVVQRVPADMSGALLEETTWAIEKVDGQKFTISQRAFKKEDNHPETGARQRKTKPGSERSGKVLGGKSGKLRNNLGLRVIAGNYGVALFDPELKLDPEIIPHHQVWKRLDALKAKNGGKPVRVLKNGMLIEVFKGRYAGTWRIRACKDNARSGLLVTLAHPDRVPATASGVVWAKDNVLVTTLLKDGLQILPSRLTGIIPKV